MSCVDHSFWKRRLGFALTAAAVFSAAVLSWAQEQAVEAPDFNNVIRPILSENCFVCHGPDETQRKANLRLDLKTDVFSDARGYSIVTPGKPDESPLYTRIAEENEHYRMPPIASGKKLEPEQIEAIRRWIEAGAEWKEHWAFIPPTRPEPPADLGDARLYNAIDAFIQKRLQKKGLSMSPEADRRVLARRVSLDLTGLPPSIEEVEAFLADKSPDAYDRYVTRLMAKPAYGEHMARYWLDAARYADTHGLHLDNYREMWPYRDWVINAFNANMPFDQFTIEQLAGDLLPEPTLQQQIATGFNRCNVTTSEGGSINDEVYVRYAVDRAGAASTVWMGLTVGCAQCHDHKYDPISQKEFYQLFAYFNNVAEPAMDGNRKDTPPIVKVPTAEQDARLAQLSDQIKTFAARIKNEAVPEVDAAQAEWEARQARWTPLRPHAFTSQGKAALKLLDDHSLLASGENADKEIYEVAAEMPAGSFHAIRLEAIPDSSLPKGSSGRSDNGNSVLTEFEAEIASAEKPDEWKRIAFSEAWADYEQAQEFAVGNALDGKPETGWGLSGRQNRNVHAVFLADKPFSVKSAGRIRFRLKYESPHAKHQHGRFRLSITDAPFLEPVGSYAVFEDWHQIGPFEAENASAALRRAFAPENENVNLGKNYKVNGKDYKWQKKAEWKTELNAAASEKPAVSYFYRNIRSDASQRAVIQLETDGHFKVFLNREELYESPYGSVSPASVHRFQLPLRPGNNQLVVKHLHTNADAVVNIETATEEPIVPADIVDAIATAPAERDDAAAQKIQRHYREFITKDPLIRDWFAQSADLQKQKTDLENGFATTLVMRELEKPRGAYVLERGAYDKRGEEVQPNIPAVLPPLPDDAPPNRMSLAKWLVDPGHPLTARVTVNRLWQQVFGAGIARTAEDFGSQGEPPTHPELLDWLAMEFIESGWDVRHMMRLMVSSAAYRQSSQATPELLAADPENRLYARGPRFRLDAETIRDQALALSGLLHEQIGGPSVKPPQPAGLWKAVGYVGSNTDTFVADKDPNKIYRRSLYTFWKRTAPPPQMNLFDAPSREECVVRRERTNTPMQALALMNDAQYFTAAKAFAARMMNGSESDGDAERLRRGFLIAAARPPSDQEAAILLETLEAQRVEFQADIESAAKIVGPVPEGEAQISDEEQIELAAWTMLANLIMNLDEILNKG